MEYLNKGMELFAYRMIDPSSGVKLSVIRMVAIARPMDLPCIAMAVS